MKRMQLMITMHIRLHPHVFHKSKPLPSSQIPKIGLIPIRLPLERRVPVPLHETPVANAFAHPFSHIHHIKRHIQHLPYLRRMYQLVVYAPLAQFPFGKNHPKQIYCQKAPERYVFVIYNLSHLNHLLFSAHFHPYKWEHPLLHIIYI